MKHTGYIIDFILENIEKELVYASITYKSDISQDGLSIAKKMLKNVEIVDCTINSKYNILIGLCDYIDGGRSHLYLSENPNMGEKSIKVLNDINNMIQKFKKDILENYSSNSNYIPICIIKNDTNIFNHMDIDNTLNYYILTFISTNNHCIQLIYHSDENVEREIEKFKKMLSKRLYADLILDKVSIYLMDNIFDMNKMKIKKSPLTSIIKSIIDYNVYIGDIYCGEFCSTVEEKEFPKEFLDCLERR